MVLHRFEQDNSIRSKGFAALSAIECVSIEINISREIKSTVEKERKNGN